MHDHIVFCNKCIILKKVRQSPSTYMPQNPAFQETRMQNSLSNYLPSGSTHFPITSFTVLLINPPPSFPGDSLPSATPAQDAKDFNISTNIATRLFRIVLAKALSFAHFWKIHECHELWRMSTGEWSEVAIAAASGWSHSPHLYNSRRHLPYAYTYTKQLIIL